MILAIVSRSSSEPGRIICSRLAMPRGAACQRRRLIAALAVLLLARLHARCDGADAPIDGAAAPVTGEVLGTGTVKVALLLPLSATGNAAQLAKDLRNAADLALREFPNANLQILVKDDRGTPDGARAGRDGRDRRGRRADPRAALRPVGGRPPPRWPSPRRADHRLLDRHRRRASQGVYLLSFLPQSDVDRIITLRREPGQAVLSPRSCRPTPTAPSSRRRCSAPSATPAAAIVAIERYDLDRVSMQEKADRRRRPHQAGHGQHDLHARWRRRGAVPGADPRRQRRRARRQIKYLGSGQWNDPRVARRIEPRRRLVSRPGRPASSAFAARYQAAFGTTPSANASLAYDAMSLAAGLAARFGAAGLHRQGADQPERLHRRRRRLPLPCQRHQPAGLAVYEIERGQPTVIDRRRRRPSRDRLSGT